MRSFHIDHSPVMYLFRAVVVVYLMLLVAWPLALVARSAFAAGAGAFLATFDDPLVQSSLRLTAIAAVAAVAVNVVFGVGISLLLVRYDFPGKRALSTLLDLPLSVSPVVAGLAIVLVYNGRDGWFGPAFEGAGIEVLFATPAIVMATAFVSLPLVIRELVPVLEELGIEQEQAAFSLGAGPVTTMRRITLPSIKWALVYGVVLTLARSLGEFGAVKIVSGNLIGRTQTATLVVEQQYQDFAKGDAYAIAFLLAFIAVACIVTISFLRPNERP